jgi:hypothetical protein
LRFVVSQDDFVRILEPVERIRTRLGELSRSGPPVGSRAARDSRTRLGETAWILGLATGSVGVDHLLGWQTIRATLQPAFSHWTLIRGAIEGLAVTRWLCDPAIRGDERIQRAAGVQLADYKQRLAFERHIISKLREPAVQAKPKGPGRTAEERIAELEQRLGRVPPIVMPSATDLFERYAVADEDEAFKGAQLFRLISGIAHSKVWSLYAMSQRGEKVEHGGGRGAVHVAADEGLVLRATAVAMRVAKEALADVEWYAATD